MQFSIVFMSLVPLVMELTMMLTLLMMIGLLMLNFMTMVMVVLNVRYMIDDAI